MKKIALLLFLLFTFTPLTCQNASAKTEGTDDDLWEIIYRIIRAIIEAIEKIPSQIIEGIENLFWKILDVFAKSMVSSVSSAVSSLFVIDFDPIQKLVSKTVSFISNTAFSIAYLSFFISLGLYVSPVSEEFSAKGKNGLIDSCLCVILLSMSPIIHSFFSYLSSSLSLAIMSGVDQTDLVGIITNILLSLVTGLFFLLLIDAIALLIACVLIVVSFILSLIAPILFLIAIMVYALPIQIAKNTANRIFVNSIFCYFLTPIGWSIVALNQIILSTIVNPLTPLIILFFDIAILYITFSISKEIGASYPVLGFIRKSVTTAIFMGTLYLASGKFSGIKTSDKGGEGNEQ